MEPVPETREALRWLARSGDATVAATLATIARAVREVVPDTVGVSLGLTDDRFTFTVVADSELVLELDAVQYVDDGPCVAAMDTDQIIGTVTADLLDERRWQMFARSLAIHGVESTLSLPVPQDGRVVAGVNLYASTPDAFVGHHAELAAICGAWAPGATSNADLSFSTLIVAAETPGRMREAIVDKAVELLAASQRVSIRDAATRVREAAARARISQAMAASSIIRALSRP
jgi:GAF domain-containing protein